MEAAANRICAALPNAGAPCSNPGTPYSQFSTALSNGPAPAVARRASAPPAPAISEEVADMAAGWSQLLVSELGSGSIASVGLAGIAASVLVAACPRWGCILMLAVQVTDWQVTMSVIMALGGVLVCCTSRYSKNISAKCYGSVQVRGPISGCEWSGSTDSSAHDCPAAVVGDPLRDGCAGGRYARLRPRRLRNCSGLVDPAPPSAHR